MVRVWFNHWFSTSYGLIELMKQDAKDEIYVIGTNKRVDSVIQKVCDEWYQDPTTDGEEYLRYCLDFCVEHHVDVFVPRRKMVDISQNRKRFEEIGVRIMVDDYEVIRLLNDKAAAYDFFKECSEIHIPDYAIVTDVDGFVREYARLREDYDQVCVKFVQDEGAMSYRRIAENVDKSKSLRIYPGAQTSYEDYLEGLMGLGSFSPLMVMPYLPGEEISVDCLNTPTGLIAVPRYKGSARQEEIHYDEEILKMVHAIMEKTKLKCPCNIQFKLRDGMPYLLEVNTRMSGGLQMSCLAEDINIPNIALNLVLGREVSWSFQPKERVVSYIEIPKIIR